MTRLVAVLGFSDGTCADLHPVCATRLARAAEETRPEDVVLFTGWARRGTTSSEAELMAASWSTPVRGRLVDGEARTTLGNAISVARAAREVGAEEVVVVTSRWHARRAGVLVRATLLGSRATLRVAAADEPPTPARRAREAASWLVVPILAVLAAGMR